MSDDKTDKDKETKTEEEKDVVRCEACGMKHEKSAEVKHCEGCGNEIPASK